MSYNSICTFTVCHFPVLPPPTTSEESSVKVVIAVTADFQACIEDETVSQIVGQRTLAATAALTLA